MKLSSQIKPISDLKAHASEIVRTLGDRGEPLVITQNSEAIGGRCWTSTASRLRRRRWRFC